MLKVIFDEKNNNNSGLRPHIAVNYSTNRFELILIEKGIKSKDHHQLWSCGSGILGGRMVPARKSYTASVE
jgi:hypothetical protein